MKISKDTILLKLISIIIIMSYLSFEIHIYKNYYKIMQLAISFMILICFFIVGINSSLGKKYMKNIKGNKAVYVLCLLMITSMLVNAVSNNNVTIFDCVTVAIFAFNIIFFYVLLPVFLTEKAENKKSIFKLITALSTVISIIGIAIYLKKGLLGYSLIYNRSASILYDPNFFAILAAVPICINVDSKKKMRFVIYIINFIAIITTGSRGTLICLMVTLLLYILIFKKDKLIKKIAILGLLSFVMIIILNYLYTTDFFRLYQGSNGRFEMIIFAIEMVCKRPIIGYGYGTIDVLLKNANFLNASTHNSMIDFIFSFGIIATVIYVYIIIKSLYRGIKNKEEPCVITTMILLILNMNTILYSFGGIGITSLLLTIFLGLTAYKEKE